MSFRPPFDKPPSRDEETPVPQGIRVSAHIEGLIGEERRMLEIEHDSRSRHHHERLKEIEAELDHVFERLKERAEHRGRHRSEPKT